MLNRASRGESPDDFRLEPVLSPPPPPPSWLLSHSLWSQGLTMPGCPPGCDLCKAAVLWDKMSSIQKDLTPRIQEFIISHFQHFYRKKNRYFLIDIFFGEIRFSPAFLFCRVRGIVRTNLRHRISVTITVLSKTFEWSEVILPCVASFIVCEQHSSSWS